MKTGKYSLRELLTHNEIEQFLIPELQRDYVWSPNEIEKVWNSFFKKFLNKTTSNIIIFENDKQIEHSSVSSYLEKTYHILISKTKMGFVYAYHDKEMPGKFFLIDGQQRLTSFYLILLAIYVKAEIQDKFIKNYYENNLPKIDYKVRESAFEFLRLFLDDTLAGRNFTENKNYFSQAYKNDKTVNNIIKNYDYIYNQINKISEKEELFRLLDYVENYIEFNYFDTKLSDQGESLYLYMNSRGFHLSHQEKLRASLIEKEPKEKKKNAGKLWEDWQDFFFEYRYDNENADKGFEEFLYFSSLLKKQELGKLSASDLNNFENLKDFQIQYLDIAFLKKSFSSLKAMLLWDSQVKHYEEDYFLRIKSDQVYIFRTLFRYLPVWYYHLKFSPDSEKLLYFRLFIVNQSHTRKVVDDPTVNIINALAFVENLEDADLLKSETKENSFYNAHEFEKLDLSNKNPVFLKFVEKLYFDYKFQELLEGRSDILFELAKISLDAQFDVDQVEKIILVLKNIFISSENTSLERNLNSKILRRYILTYFDFNSLSGGSNYGEKYNLIKDNRGWLSRVLGNNNFTGVLDQWTGNVSLQDNFLIKKPLFNNEFDWRYYFIHYANVLNHCENNHFIKNENIADIILINKEKQTAGDSYLAVKVFENFGICNGYFRQHQLRTAYLDVVILDDQILVFFDEIPRLTIDLVYQEKGSWYLEVFYKDLADDAILDVLKWEGYIKQDDKKWRKTNFYIHNENSLQDNLVVLRDKVKDVINDLKSKDLIPVKK
ncbi:DUF262 domain-containing protein [Chryseobacterium jejuense]|uniref:Uncharacterized conserved protein n=1 Tax=Chryseobacterium jejuense TaxID=445960 RepID=A0A2X2XMK7_CHRJE|nr:DUF262 domain-containing protein [Chryseobacterium jejuense]SDI85340.1 Protein of unknown function DUF262 [Chryseobacterium jejuense]SQB27610.1 Uncharacterized conserved protein [Chryseobacterium jejuense]